MDDSKFEEWQATLLIRGDEAFLPGEVVPADRRRAIDHDPKVNKRRAQWRAAKRRARQAATR